MLTASDIVLLTRLFGPRVELLDPEAKAFISEVGEVAKGIDSKGSIERAALNVLLANIIHTGLGKTPIGWSLSDDGEWHKLEVYVLKRLAAAA